MLDILNQKELHGLSYTDQVRKLLGVDETALPDSDVRLAPEGIDAQLAENDTLYELSQHGIDWTSFAAGSAELRYLFFACCYRLAYTIFDSVHDISIERMRIGDMDVQRNILGLQELRAQLDCRWALLLKTLAGDLGHLPILDVLDGSDATTHARPDCT